MIHKLEQGKEKIFFNTDHVERIHFDSLLKKPEMVLVSGQSFILEEEEANKLLRILTSEKGNSC